MVVQHQNPWGIMKENGIMYCRGHQRQSLVVALGLLVVALLLNSSTGFSSPSLFGQRSRSNTMPHPTTTPTSGSRSSTRSTTQLFGIPKMFRWLTDQYPNINRRLSEGLSPDVTVDNFYLDMNGIIHPCTHGNSEDEIIMLDETAMFKKIFLYVDRLYKLVKPRKVLYLAVDGVAPRAKMNQQRSRRFRAAKEAEELAAQIMARDGQQQGSTTLLQNNNVKPFDSNCITPGTDFMLKLSLALQKWVQYKMETDPFWQQQADVVVSGPDVPGEGEHKVMDYIRQQKERYYEHQQQQKEGTKDLDSVPPIIHWGPSWTHVLYGLDADLIMLGLVTHEPNFMLLREKMSVVMAGRGRSKNRKRKDMMEYDQNDFEVLELRSLRQLLAIQFRRFADPGMLKVKYDLSRIVDDFVFACMLVGNDFLPQIPHLAINNGAISLMMSSYIDLLPEWGDYLTDKHRIHPERFEQFMYSLSAYESEHFRRRSVEENEPGWKLSVQNELEDDDLYGTYYDGKPTPAAAVAANRKSEVNGPPPTFFQVEPFSTNQNKQQSSSNNDIADAAGNRKFRRLHPDSTARSYRDFYYETKLGWSTVLDRNNTLFRRRLLVRDYIEGLHWILNYYHNGCQSWSWFFPYLYSPLATDMVNLREFYDDQEDDNVNGFRAFPFNQGEPFPSLAQLLSVLPPQSAPLLPRPLAELMWHPSSPLVKYYPQDFTTDANGKRESWEAVVQIPFIDADVLLDTVQQITDADVTAAKQGKEGYLTNAERKRNIRGKDHVFVAPRPVINNEDHLPTIMGPIPGSFSSSSANAETFNEGRVVRQRTKADPNQPAESRQPVPRSRRTSSKGTSRNDVDPKIR